MLRLKENAEETFSEDVNLELESSADSHSFLPIPRKEPTKYTAIHSIIHNELVDWPDLAEPSVKKFRAPGLATMAFPVLFPYGSGDPTYPGRQRDVSLTDGFKHLMKYGEETPNQKLYWRFANHPRFPYWA